MTLELTDQVGEDLVVEPKALIDPRRPPPLSISKQRHLIIPHCSLDTFMFSTHHDGSLYYTW